MEHCKFCDSLQHVPEGNGPSRPKFIPPTIYDHIENYKQFKEKKDTEQQVQETKEKLLTQNTKFTNYSIDVEKLEDCLRKFSTQEIAVFKANKFENPNKEKQNFPTDEISKKIDPDCLTNLSRSPVHCPVHACNKIVGITSVLSHFIRDHTQNMPVDFQDIDGTKRSILMFDESIFVPGEPLCLGILVYSGLDSSESSRPGIKGISRPNSFLPERYSRYLNHLPILVMGCKTSFSWFLKDKEMAKKYFDPHDTKRDIIVLWLATVETTKRIHCTITAFDSSMKSSRSTIVEVRNLRSSQKPEEFLSKEINYLMLKRGDVNVLSNNGESSIQMEIFIHEY